MFVSPGSPTWLGRKLTRDAAEQMARNWRSLLVEGMLLIVAGVLIFSINWSVRSLATFIGALFILHGVTRAATRALDRSAQTTNTVAGLLSIGAGVAIIVWPGPGLLAVAIFLGAWLIVMGTLSISGAFAGRHVLPDWWLLLILGLLEIPLGVLALADPGATLAALVTVGGIWAVAVGVMEIVIAFELKRLPERVDAMWKEAAADEAPARAEPGAERFSTARS